MPKSTYPDRWPQPALLQVAMVSNPTFNSWRKRNGLLPRDEEKGKRNFFSTADMCIARTMVVLVNNGVTADAAAKAAMGTQGFFKHLCEVDGAGMIQDNIYIYSDGRLVIADVDNRIEDTMRGANSVGECGLILDLGKIILKVMLGIHNWQGMKLKVEGGPPFMPHESFVDHAEGGAGFIPAEHPATRQHALNKLEEARDQIDHMLKVIRKLDGNREGGSDA